MNAMPLLDLLAIGYFVLTWGSYSTVVERSWRKRDGGLSARMHHYREVWMSRVMLREVRIVDIQIIASLQNGTAFFASTTLLAIGGSLTLLRATGEAVNVVSALPFGIRTTPEQWEIKAAGLIVIFIYAFFKFAWAYRLFNYVAILLGAMPFPAAANTTEGQTHVLRTAGVFQAAGEHFNRGQRAFFLALGYLGWFAGPWVLFASTTAVIVVMWRRQFASAAHHALMTELPASAAPATAPETAPNSGP